MAGMTETEVSGELFEFGEDRQFNAKIVGTRVDNPNIVKSNENSSTTTVPKTGIAIDENSGRKLFINTVKAEQKVKFLRQLSVGGGGY